mgnify:CR=1 FL=1
MKRYAAERSANQPKPVEKVEVKEGGTKKRIVLLIVAILVALGAFTYAISTLVTVEKGWRVIEATSASEMNCAQDFTFQYYLGGSGANAAAENKELSMLYTKATEDAYQIFNAREASLTYNNLYYLNRRPNQPVQVPQELYAAFELVEKTGSRYMYLGPAFQEYHSIFFCTEDWETESFDPYQNEDQKAYLQAVAQFAADPAHVQVQLMGDNTVQLYVSESYLAFARENGIVDFVDLYLLQDAFIVDYLAETIEKAGYNRGMLSSYDGYTRCLSESQISYTTPLYNPVDATHVEKAADVQVMGGTALVQMHSMPFNARKELYYYQFKNGDTRTAYLDEKDGLCKAAVPVLFATSREMSCAEAALRLMPFYAADTLDENGLKALEAEGLYPLYCEGKNLLSADPQVTLKPVTEGYTVKTK